MRQPLRAVVAKTRLRTAAATIVVVCGTGGGLLVSGAFAGNAAATATAPVTDPVTNIAATMKADYGMLSVNTAASETALPSTLTSRPSFQEAVKRFGLDVPAARMTTASGYDEWLIPGTSGYSYVIQNPAGEWVRGGGASLPADGFLGSVALNPDGSHSIAGLVPDGDTSVTLTDAAGVTMTASVSGNAFESTAPSSFGGFASVKASNAAGTLVTSATQGP